MPMQVSLNINEAKVSFIEFTVNPVSPPKNPMNLAIEIGNSKNQKGFYVRFKITIFEKVENYLLKVEYNVIFNSTEKIKDNFFKSSFAKANAPAIAFPYLRAYLSNLTMQSGYKPLHLGSVNFVALSKKSKIKI